MFANKKKQQTRSGSSFETEPAGHRKKPNTKQAEDEYLLMKDDTDDIDDQKYNGTINTADLALTIKNNETIPDNLAQSNESFLGKFANIDENILGFINFIIIITASLFMLFEIYENNGMTQENNRQWTEQFVIFFFAMVVIPLVFVVIRTNIIVLHNRYYADYGHCLLIFVFVAFFVFVTVSLIANDDISGETINALLILSYLIIHFFIFNLTSRFWIFIHIQKFNTFLALWLLTVIAFIFSVIIYIYYNDNQTFDMFYDELYLLRSYYILLWIVSITGIHFRQFKAMALSHPKLGFLLNLERLVSEVCTPLLYVCLGYDTRDKRDFVDYLSNALICAAVTQLILISVICTRKTGQTSINSFSFYTPAMSQCCVHSSSAKCAHLFWTLICGISLPLLCVQACTLCLYLDSADDTWRKMDTFLGFALLWLMLILTLGFAVVPSSVFSNFWKRKVFAHFLFLDLESLQILYNASRIKQRYGGLTHNRRFLSLSSEGLIAPWTSEYTAIDCNHPSFRLCQNLQSGIRTTAFVHFNYALKQESLWRKVFCCLCDRENIERSDIKYHFEGNGDESLVINTAELGQFTEFYPTKFAEIRAWNGLSSHIYITTFESALLAFIANSKSGMYFFYSANGKFLIKSLKRSEFHFFRTIFGDYYEYLKRNQNTIINKFFGMYATQSGNETLYFIVIESIFYSDVSADAMYDLKGSTKGRIAKAAKEKVLKDLNWKSDQQSIRIGHRASVLYKAQLRKDTHFLQSLGIMDYSLLVGIHRINSAKNNENIQYRISDSFHCQALSPYLFTFCHRGMLSKDKSEIYFGGIIDILQKYNAKKKVENVMRRIKNDQSEISCAPPHVYAQRMLQFLDEYIV